MAVLPMKSIGFRNAYLYFLIAAFFISSDDTLFVVRVPFALRFSLILLGFFVLFGLLKVTQAAKITLPTGYLYLLGWAVASVFSLQFTPVPYFSLVQTLFFLFDVGLVFVIVNVVTPANFGRLLNFYFISFAVMATFGLAQFFGGLVGFKLLAVQQWTPHLNRINGLSYEPSYFAVYLSAGMITLGYLSYKKFDGLKRIGLYYNLTVTAMILSSSRTGFTLVLVWYARLLPAALNNFMNGRLSKRLLRGLVVAFTVSAAATLVVIVAGPQKFLFLLEGTGLQNSETYSLDDRQDSAAQTWQIYAEHPIFGTGIGGVNYYVTILRTGVATQDPVLLKMYTGNNIFLETLSSVGIFGFFFSFMYFWKLATKAFAMRRQNTVVVALALGLLSEIYLLQFAQDIERIYLWLQIAMLSAAINVYRQPTRQETNAL